MYFAFLDFYLNSLVLPAVICSLFVSSFTMSYAVFISLWGLLMQALWTRRESTLARMFNTQGIDKEAKTRLGFKPKEVQVLNSFNARLMQ
jgi:hypothetical protein